MSVLEPIRSRGSGAAGIVHGNEWSWFNHARYDGFGNLYQKNVTAGSAPSMSYSVNEATNQLNGLGYDANGNVTNPPGGGTLTYDFLNRVVAVTGGVQYSYDASNKRVWKLNANGEAYYLYDINGENLGTFTPQIEADPTSLYLQPVAWQERAYFFGKKLFVAEDNVGSALASSPSTRSFYPYGEPKSGTAATEQYSFATYWRDSETDLDYARNRYYSSTLGRFLSPDLYLGSMHAGNPGSFNRYSYVLDDPINHNDPRGLDCAVEDEDPDDFDGTGGGDGDCTSSGGDGCDGDYTACVFDSSDGVNPITFCEIYPNDPQCGGSGGGNGSAGGDPSGMSIAQDGLSYWLNKTSLSPQCEKDLTDVGIEPYMGSSGGPTDDLSQIQNAASSAVVLDGLTASNYTMADLYANSSPPGAANYLPNPNETVEQEFVSSPSTSAMAQLGGNLIFVNPTNFADFGGGYAAAVMLHELIHNITGLTDPDIERDLPGLAQNQGTNAITLKLLDCI